MLLVLPVRVLNALLQGIQVLREFLAILHQCTANVVHGVGHVVRYFLQARCRFHVFGPQTLGNAFAVQIIELWQVFDRQVLQLLR